MSSSLGKQGGFIRKVWLAAGLLLGLALAHHGWSSYDASRVITATGTVTEITFEFPHATIWMEVPPSGLTLQRKWYVVLAPPSRMEARGLPNGSLKVGARVTVVGYPHRTEREEMRAERIILDGKTVELR